MDILIIGKVSHNRNDAPTVIYCGQDRNAAAAAVEATAGKFPRIYEVNPEPFRPIAAPIAPHPVAVIPPKQEQEQEQEQAATAAKPARKLASRPS